MSVIQVQDNKWNLNSIITDKFEVIQNVNTRLAEFKQDCFFNLDAGLDWVNYIGADLSLMDTIQSEVAIIIGQTKDVIGIKNINLKVENNNFTIEYSILTRFGDINLIYNMTNE